ncbi:hypothetical protein NQ317_011282 [Molorchus minor]|uniref:Uncharacterized protein n=1 Tax=Molorchus minor TaxID=1323400 RepID=A0ABQ9IXD3_9CUCU|nr:hypothetical protein NQ317_011282 [Molorchus minor]
MEKSFTKADSDNVPTVDSDMANDFFDSFFSTRYAILIKSSLNHCLIQAIPPDNSETFENSVTKSIVKAKNMPLLLSQPGLGPAMAELHT